MKNVIRLLLIISLLSIIPLRAIEAQTEEDLNLDLSRDFGYSSGTGKIQGTFSMRVSGPDNLSRVEFLMDGKVIADVIEPPFRFQFNTDTYSLGIHTLSAVGYTTDDKVLQSNERRVEFVSAQEGSQQALKIVLPLLAVVFLIAIFSILIPTLTTKGKNSVVPLGSPRKYGISGGAICPKCGRPFSIHFFGLNLLIGKLDRCPHCGRWSIVRSVSPQELRAAELAELSQISQGEKDLQPQVEDKLKKEIEDSKYQDI
jgi:Bacterial Ig domain